MNVKNVKLMAVAAVIIAVCLLFSWVQYGDESPEVDDTFDGVWYPVYTYDSGISAEITAPEQLEAIPHFYLRGAFDYGKLSFSRKAMMGLMRRMLEREKNPAPDQLGMLEAFRTPVDFNSREALEPLLRLAAEWEGG